MKCYFVVIIEDLWVRPAILWHFQRDIYANTDRTQHFIYRNYLWQSLFFRSRVFNIMRCGNVIFKITIVQFFLKNHCIYLYVEIVHSQDPSLKILLVLRLSLMLPLQHANGQKDRYTMIAHIILILLLLLQSSVLRLVCSSLHLPVVPVL